MKTHGGSLIRMARLPQVVLKMVSAMQSLSLIVCLAMLFGRTNVVSSTESEVPRIRKQHALFVFGDSIYDPGNNNLISALSIKQIFHHTEKVTSSFLPEGFAMDVLFLISLVFCIFLNYILIQFDQ